MKLLQVTIATINKRKSTYCRNKKVSHAHRNVYVHMNFNILFGEKNPAKEGSMRENY